MRALFGENAFGDIVKNRTVRWRGGEGGGHFPSNGRGDLRFFQMREDGGLHPGGEAVISSPDWMAQCAKVCHESRKIARKIAFPPKVRDKEKPVDLG